MSLVLWDDDDRLTDSLTLRPSHASSECRTGNGNERTISSKVDLSINWLSAFRDLQAKDKAELALVRMVADQKQQNQWFSENMVQKFE
uniref:Uncharacterized protein n=1 Tax=Romanomermis culicivorax TaxID=13658 RepID=A0A915IP03_ROMCU